jgi:hypothetical protein
MGRQWIKALVGSHARSQGSRITNLDVWENGQLPAAAQTLAGLKERGFAVLTARAGCEVMDVSAVRLHHISSSWDRLPPDRYLRDGGHYRFRRHSCFIQDQHSGQITAVPHRAHWQSAQYNTLHGGIDRLFEPIESEVRSAPAWTHLLGHIGQLFAQVRAVERWFIEAHQFRIDTADGIGRPTPEGPHRDGVDFVAVILMQRRGVRGGETRVTEPDGSSAGCSTLDDPGSMLLMDDARVIHETSPILPTTAFGIRDTLVLTYRANGFQTSPSTTRIDPRRTGTD